MVINNFSFKDIVMLNETFQVQGTSTQGFVPTNVLCQRVLGLFLDIVLLMSRVFLFVSACMIHSIAVGYFGGGRGSI